MRKKDKLTKEQEFVRLCLQSNMANPIQSALEAGIIKTPGEKKLSEILTIFEQSLTNLQVIDLFRKIGLHEVFVAVNLKKLIEDENAPTNARVQALNIASKCLNLQKDLVAGDAEIVITKARRKRGKPGRPKKGFI